VTGPGPVDGDHQPMAEGQRQRGDRRVRERDAISGAPTSVSCHVENVPNLPDISHDVRDRSHGVRDRNMDGGVPARPGSVADSKSCKFQRCSSTDRGRYVDV